MSYDCRFQATIREHIPAEYYRYIAKEQKQKIKLPEPKAMFVKKCMTRALSRKIPPSPSSLQLERSKRNGLKHSIFNFKKDVYIGEWKDDEKDGRGMLKTKDENILYEGDWVNGEADGYGVLCRQGDHKRYNIIHEGFWRDGKPQNQGRHVYKDGSYYEGGWDSGHRNGYGKMWYANGTYYEGFFFNNVRHGKGLFLFKNGNRYLGGWDKNVKQGFGAYYFMNNGKIQMGHWVKDSCVNSWMIDMKYRQTVVSPTEFSIPRKIPVVKQFKRYIKLQEKRSDHKNASTQTDD